eukprot:gene19553-biopygen31400
MNMLSTLRAEERRALCAGEQPLRVEMRFSAPPHRNAHTYQLPESPEVARVFTSEDGGPHAMDMVVYPRTGGARCIDPLHPRVDPMCYMLLFPDGTPGFCRARFAPDSKGRRKKIVPVEFYRHRLMLRSALPTTISLPHAGRRLFQQYVVDCYCKVEAERLSYYRERQSAVRTEKLRVLEDHLHDSARDASLNPGRLIVLPSSYWERCTARTGRYQSTLVEFAIAR